MNSKELKSYFLANKNKWIFLDENINEKNVQIKAFIGGTVDMQILKIDGVFCGKLNYQSITKTVTHIFEYVNL